MTKKLLSLFLISFISFSVSAQDDLLDELNEETKNDTSYELPAFKTMKIGNLQSTKIADKGDFYLVVSHRFGTLKNGFDNFFGLDEANTKIQLLYSFWDNVQLSISRESWRKLYAGAIKVGIAKQSNNFPFNIVAYGTAAINSQIEKANYPALKFADRMSYVGQLLVSKRFSSDFSFEIVPSYIRENLQDINFTGASNHNQFAMAFGGRYKLSKRVSLNAEYSYNFSRDKNSTFADPYTIGVDIETGGHVFQLLFTNAQSTNEVGFLSNATKNDIFFGFNIVRVF